jgi:hypothetical protein
MTKEVLFLQGAGEGAYKEDETLAKSLERSLGSDYSIHYPAMPDEDNPDYELWEDAIKEELMALQGPVFLVGHSLGASFLIKHLSEATLDKPIAGIFLIAAPYWGGAGWLYEGYEKLALPKNAASLLPADTPFFLYQGREDEVVPFTHLGMYAREFPKAVVRELDGQGHQLDNDLSIVAEDIKNIASGS